MSMQIGRERSLQKALRPVLEDYDFVCIDTPPVAGPSDDQRLDGRHKVIVPVQCEYLSMRGLVQLQNTLSMIREELNPNVEIEGILPTLVDSRTVHAKEAIEILEENFGDRVFATRIRKTIRFAEAPVKGTSVLKYDPDGVAAKSYRELAKEVLGNGEAVSGRACVKGPLAELFRKTTQDDGDEQAPAPKRSEEQPRAAGCAEAGPAATIAPARGGRAAHPERQGAPDRRLLARHPERRARASRARTYRPRDEPSAVPRKMRGPFCAWSASAAPASTRSTAWSRPGSRASSSSPSTPISSRSRRAPRT